MDSELVALEEKFTKVLLKFATKLDFTLNNALKNTEEIGVILGIPSIPLSKEKASEGPLNPRVAKVVDVLHEVVCLNDQLGHILQSLKTTNNSNSNNKGNQPSPTPVRRSASFPTSPLSSPFPSSSSSSRSVSISSTSAPAITQQSSPPLHRWREITTPSSIAAPPSSTDNDNDSSSENSDDEKPTNTGPRAKVDIKNLLDRIDEEIEVEKKANPKQKKRKKQAPNNNEAPKSHPDDSFLMPTPTASGSNMISPVKASIVAQPAVRGLQLGHSRSKAEDVGSISPTTSNEQRRSSVGESQPIIQETTPISPVHKTSTPIQIATSQATAPQAIPPLQIPVQSQPSPVPKQSPRMEKAQRRFFKKSSSEKDFG